LFALIRQQDYSNAKPNANYKYWNKPFGTKHWLEKRLGYPSNPIDDDAVVILFDPDQIIVRPFRDNDFSRTTWKFLAPSDTPRTSVVHGHPMGQLYGFGLQYLDKIDMLKLDATSPVRSLSRERARRYVVGPPYVATARDMYSIASKWAEFAVPVWEQYPKLLAEMFAYCLASAHLRLEHQVASDFMVSDVGAGSGEGWTGIDEGIRASDVCEPLARDYLTSPSANAAAADNGEALLPNVLHYCQRYGLGRWFFGKYRLYENFLSCASPLHAVPPSDFALNTTTLTTYFPDGKTKRWSPLLAKRNAFMICQLLKGANEAAKFYKRTACGGGKGKGKGTGTTAGNDDNNNTTTTAINYDEVLVYNVMEEHPAYRLPPAS